MIPPDSRKIKSEAQNARFQGVPETEQESPEKMIIAVAGRVKRRVKIRYSSNHLTGGNAMLIKPFQHKSPRIHESAFVAETAAVIGDVVIGARASIWYGVVLRGDINSIRIGDETNIQDNAVVHVDDEKRGGDNGRAVIGNRVTIGHGAIIHACRIGDNSLIGMGAVVLSRAEIGENCIVAAGAVVKEAMIVPPNSLVAGTPAVIKSTLTPEKIAGLAPHAIRYAELGAEFRRST